MSEKLTADMKPTEDRTVMDVIRVQLVCRCGELLAYQGKEVNVDPPVYQHKCSNGHEWFMDATYPQFVCEEKDTLDTILEPDET